jgi:glycerophosphoryl diester phosphodiesterase
VRGQNKGEGEQIPTLEQVVRFVKGKIQLNIEIKEGGEIYPGIEKNLLSLLVQEQFVDQCIVSSFDAPTLRQIKSLTGRGEALRPGSGQACLTPRCGLIFDRQPMVGLQGAVDIGLDIIHPRWTICTPELVQQARQKKKKVIVWTVNTPGQVEYFKKLGVDGMMSDYPDIL